MNIGYDVSYIQVRRAGIGRHALELLRSLLESGSGHHFILHGWSNSLDVELLKTLSAENVKLSLARIPGNVKRFYWNKVRTPSLELITGSLDCFHSTDPFLPPLTRASRISTVHDLAYLRFPDFFEDHILAWDTYVRRSVQSADAIIVPSEQTKNDVMEFLNIPDERIHLVQPPVSRKVDFFQKSDRDNEIVRQLGLTAPYVLYVGTIEPRKNIPTLVRGFEQSAREHPSDVMLVLAGKRGWKWEESIEAIQTSPYYDRIRHLDYVTEEQLAALYRKAICFVYPSFFEGYGFPVLEAMASGIPIITSANSSLREIADGVALLVEPEKSEDIAEALTMLISNEVRRVEMRQRGLEIVKQFSGTRAANQVLGVYASLGNG